MTQATRLGMRPERTWVATEETQRPPSGSGLSVPHTPISERNDSFKAVGDALPKPVNGAAEIVFSRETSAAELLELLLENAMLSVEAALHQLSNPRLLRALAGAAQRGVRVRLLLDRTKYEENAASVSVLSNGQLTVRSLIGRQGDASRMHHKFAIVDRRTIVTGSYNWTVGSDEHNYENLVIFHGQREVDAYLREFRELWRQGTDTPVCQPTNVKRHRGDKEPVVRPKSGKAGVTSSGGDYYLYLMRHGQALAARNRKLGGAGEASLSPLGRKKVSEITRGLLRIGFDANWILSSPARQAIETAKFVAGRLQPEVPVDCCEALLPGGSVEEAVRLLSTRPERRRVLVVGHEPGLSQLAVQLLGGQGDANLKLKKGGCCLLTFKDIPPHPSGRLEWWLPPRVLRKFH